MTQILRGVAAVPEAVTAPRQGKWWNEATHQWVYTDLSKTEVPENDDDLLKDLESELDASGNPTGANDGAVKDTFYYDILEVGETRLRLKFVLVRKTHIVVSIAMLVVHLC